jgi:hypothetical protein
MIKKTKKETNKKEAIKEVLKSSTTKSVQVPLVGVIVFTFLLAISSFFAGAAWLKIKGSSSTTTKTASATFEPVKSDKPEFQFYVMSFCPYGNQMEELVKPVVDLLKNSANIRPQYIFEKIADLKTQCQQYDSSNCANYIKAGYFTTESDCKAELDTYNKKCLDEKQYLKIGNTFYGSLHGRQEATQDVREICAYNMNEDKTNWWKFIGNVNKNCTSENADTCWEEQAKQAGFDTNKITECFNNQAPELIEKEIALTTQNKVQGSPTLMINGITFPPEAAYTSDNKGTLKIGKKILTQDQYRTSDAIKEAICASFKKAPKECKTTIKATDTATAGTTNTAAAAGGSCN